MRVIPRRAFLELPKQLEVNFHTSNVVKYLQARWVLEGAGVQVRHFRSNTDPYDESYEQGQEALLRAATDEIARAVHADKVFFVEDTSLRIDALSTGDADFPGLAVKEWFATTTFQQLDVQLRSSGRDRGATIKSDIALHIPGLEDPIFVHGETSGVVADSPSPSRPLTAYPWLGSATFNAWFIPDGHVRRLSELDPEVAMEVDFRARALLKLLDRLEEFTAVLNLGQPAYRRRTSPPASIQRSLFSVTRRPFVVVGQTCAGKTTLAEAAFRELSLRHIEASSIWRMEKHESGGGGSEALATAQEVLESRGPDFVAAEILRYFDHELDGAVVTGFRTIEELTAICDFYPESVIIVIDAAERTRYERHLRRGRYGETDNLASFNELDEGQASLGLLSVAQDLADVVITNEDSIEEYQHRAVRLLSGEPLSKIPQVTRPPRFAVRRQKNQLFRALQVLASGDVMTSREISDSLAENGTRIETRNVNKVLSRVGALANRFEISTDRFSYQIRPAGLSYVRFLERRSDGVDRLAIEAPTEGGQEK